MNRREGDRLRERGKCLSIAVIQLIRLRRVPFVYFFCSFILVVTVDDVLRLSQVSFHLLCANACDRLYVRRQKMTRVPLEYNHLHQHHDEGFQHFKHIKILTSTLDDLTPQVKGKKEVSLTHKLYANISPFLGIDIMLLSLGATFNDSYVLIKLINYINRFFILAIALLSLIENILVSQSTYSSQLHWFTSNVQCTFIILSVAIYSRWRDNILTLEKQLQAITLKTHSLAHEQCSGEKTHHHNKCIIDCSKSIRFHLTNISLVWTTCYLTLSLLYLYLFTFASTSLSVSSDGDDEMAAHPAAAASAARRQESPYLMCLVYCTFVPFVQHNWIVITGGVYILFAEHLYSVKCLLLKAMNFKKKHYYMRSNAGKDSNSILLCHYKDCLLSHFEMMRLTRHFNSIFNIFPIIWLVYNLLDSLCLASTCFTVCVSTVHQKIDALRVSETLFTHLTNMLTAIIVLSRLLHLQRRSNYLADQVLLDIEVNTGVKDEIHLIHQLKSKFNRKPWWLKYKSSKHSRERKIKFIQAIQSTNHHRVNLINELTEYCVFSTRYTFITYMSLIFLFIQLSLTLPCSLYLFLSSF